MLEENELAPEILARVNAYLSRKKLLLKRGSIVDATIIAAPSSTKNADGERLRLHQRRRSEAERGSVPQLAGLQLAAAERAQLLQVDESTGRLTFRHSLTRSAVVELSTTDQRRRAHLALAEMVDQPERRAWHLGEATIEPDERVAGLLEEAAHRIGGRGDPAGAIAALTRAAHLSPLRSERSRRLAVAAFVGVETGEMGTASQLLRDARRADPAHGGGSLYAAATAAYLLSNGDNDIEAAHRLLVGAIENRTESDDDALVEALWTLSLMCWFGGGAEKWDPYHAALAELGTRVPPLLALLTATFPDPVRTAAPALDQLTTTISSLRDDIVRGAS